MPETLLVGVDGGASKTRATVISIEGRILATATVRSSSAYHREPEDAAGVVVAAVRDVLVQAQRSGPATALGAGLAGADDPATRERLIRVLTDAGLAETIAVDHDAAAALAGGTALEPGIVIIAGTGSIAFGVDASSRRARAGGWGPLLDDEGSGYAVGRAALRAVMRAYDGRGDATVLSDAMIRRFALPSAAALKMAVRGMSIDEIAAVATLVVDAAREGDTVAGAILTSAGESLAAMVAAVARALDWQRAEFPLVTVGGMLEAGDLVRRPLTSALRALGSAGRLIPAQFPPEVGGALLAARAAGLDAPALVRQLAAHGGR